MQGTLLKTTELGSTGLEITRVGYGAWAIGGGSWEFGWGPQVDEASIETIHRALELGVNWIDTPRPVGSATRRRSWAAHSKGSASPHTCSRRHHLSPGPAHVFCIA